MTPAWNTPWIAVPLWGVAVLAGIGIAEARVRSGAVHVPPPPSCPPTFDPAGGDLGDVTYVERRSGGAGPHALLPLLVVLHPRDTDPAAFADWVALHLPKPARIVAPFGFFPNGDAAQERRWTDFPPTDPVYSKELADAAVGLAAFLDVIRRCRPTLGEPIVAGYGEGAAMAYAVATESPELVAVAVGAAGPLLGDPPRAPTVVIHGRDDAVVPYDPVAAAVAAYASAGAPVQIVPMTGVGHSFAGALAVRWLDEVAKDLAAQST